MTEITQFYTSPEQIQQIATIGHNVPGFVLCIVAILFLLSELGNSSKRLFPVYTGLLVLMPNIFWIYVFFSNGLTNSIALVKIMSNYPEVYLHSLTWLTNTVGGIGEFLYKKGKLQHPLGFLFFPMIFIIDGFLSILHPHGGAGHGDIFHNLYGSVIVLVGMTMIIGRLLQDNLKRYFIYTSCILIIIGGFMLMGYTEPKTSFISAFPTVEAPSAQYFIPKNNFADVYVDTNGTYPRFVQLKTGGHIRFIKLDDSIVDIGSGPHPKHDKYPPLNVAYLEKRAEIELQFNNVGEYGYHNHGDDENVNFQGIIRVME